MSREKVVIPPDYAERVFALRRRFNLTQEQFADRLNVSFASVNRWENGQNRPTRSVWMRLMRLANSDELPLPKPNKSPFRVFPDWEDRPIRINPSHVTSYRQPRPCDMGNRSPAYELHEYTVLFMNGGHTHFIHMCEIELDKIFGVDPQWLTEVDPIAEGEHET